MSRRGASSVPTYHLVRRDMDEGEARNALLAAAGAALGVGVVVWWGARLLLGRDRVEAAPPPPPPPPGPPPADLPDPPGSGRRGSGGAG